MIFMLAIVFLPVYVGIVFETAGGLVVEEAFTEFMKENWPGLDYTSPMNHEDSCKFEMIKAAFNAGWEAGVEEWY